MTTTLLVSSFGDDTLKLNCCKVTSFAHYILGFKDLTVSGSCWYTDELREVFEVFCILCFEVPLF